MSPRKMARELYTTSYFSRTTVFASGSEYHVVLRNKPGVLPLDNPLSHGIIKTQKGAAHGGQPLRLAKYLLAARGTAGRLTHIWGYGHQDQEDQDEAYQKTKESPPPLFPHAHHPLYQGVANRLCMYSAPFAGTDPVAPCGVSCIIGCVSFLVNSIPILIAFTARFGPCRGAPFFSPKTIAAA